MKEKVLFITKYPLHTEYSIKKKFDGQIAAVRNLGYDVSHTAFDKERFYVICGEEKKTVKKIAFGNIRGYIHTKAFLDMYHTVLRLLRKERFEMVYMRSAMLDFLGYLMIRRLSKSGAKVIVEIPTYPQEKEKPRSLFRRLCGYYSGFWWKRAAKYCTLFTLIGEQGDQFLGRPAMNIDNGIKLDTIPVRRKNAVGDDVFHILALASMCNWHGYDRIITGIAQMRKEVRSKVVLDLVGAGGDGSIEKWRSLADELSVNDCVRFHGYLCGEALNGMIESASVGVGSLGLCRNGFSGASILKLREYMARGLPFIYAGEDPALSGDEPYCLQVPNDETVIDMDSVLAFIERVESNPQYPQLMRKHAEEKMSWESQFEKVFAKVREL